MKYFDADCDAGWSGMMTEREKEREREICIEDILPVYSHLPDVHTSGTE